VWSWRGGEYGGPHYVRLSWQHAASVERGLLANLGVIAAGALVAWSGRAWPDWVVGGVIGVLVLAGAVRILRLK